MHSLGLWGSRWWCLGGALRSFLAPGVGTHRKWGGRGKLRSTPPRLRHRSLWTPKRRIRWVPAPTAKNLRCALPRLRHRLLRPTRPRMECIPTPRSKKLGSASPRLCNRSLCTFRRRIRWVPTPKATNLRYAPLGLHLRPPRTPRPRTGYVPTSGHKNYGAHHLNSIICHHLRRKWAIHLYQEITFLITAFVGQPQGLFLDEINGNYYQPLVKRLAKPLQFGERMANGWLPFLPGN